MRFGLEWNCESTLNITTCNQNWRTILSKTWYFIVKPCRIFPPIRILKTVNKMTTPPMFHETVAQNLDFYYWDITHINILIFHFWSYKIRNWLNHNHHFIEKHFFWGGGLQKQYRQTICKYCCSCSMNYELKITPSNGLNDKYLSQKNLYWYHLVLFCSELHNLAFDY